MREQSRNITKYLCLDLNDKNNFEIRSIIDDNGDRKTRLYVDGKELEHIISIRLRVEFQKLVLEVSQAEHIYNKDWGGWH